MNASAKDLNRIAALPSAGGEKGGIGLAALWLLAVAAILSPEQYPWVRLAGWAFAAYRIWKQPVEGLFLLAFFAPLFDNFGVVPIGFSLKPVDMPGGANQHALASVFFSLKPVQFITLLLIGSLTLRKKLFFKDSLDWVVVGSLIGIWAISLLAGAYSEDPLKAFRVNFNFALLIVLCKVLMSMLDRRELFWKILHFYFLGVVFLCLIHAGNHVWDARWFNQETRFNNHFGFLLSMSFPLGICVLFHARKLPAKAWYLGVLVLAFFCTVLSLSRSSLYGSVFGMVLFLGLFFVRSSGETRRKILRLVGVMAILVLSTALVYDHLPGTDDAHSLFRTGSQDSGKLTTFFKVFDLQYMKHSVFEDPNGGMFGERFVQLRSVKELFLAHPFFGEGWTNRVISFHGLFYTMLTGTGLAGFSLFIYFLYRLFRALWRALKRDPDAATAVLGIALFCSLTDWLLHCLMDTYFLQFHIWLMLAMALSYIKLVFRTDELVKA